MNRRSLSDILEAGQRARLASAWNSTEAAKDFSLLPKGEYVCRILCGEFTTSRSNSTPGYKITFQVIEGEYAGRRIWHDCWLTEAAMPQTKRDLLKLGVQSIDQLDHGLPQGIRCLVEVVVRRNDDGSEYNKARSFKVLGIDPPEIDPFAPRDHQCCNGSSPTAPPAVNAGGTT